MNTVASSNLSADRIEHRAEFALPAESLGEKAVGSVRQCRDAEQHDA